jgi:sporulation protein YlmC with PRC-barrel domain
MAFVSELAGRPVTDIDGRKIGVLKDLVARSVGEFSHPVLNAIVVRSHEGERILTWQRCSFPRSL